jgi:acyl-CoA thioesterase FadM
MVTARTVWAFADTVRARPVRIPKVLVDDFTVEDG